MRFRRYSDPTPARTALALLAMTASSEQLATAENTLVWLATNQPPEDTYKAALDELRLTVQVVAEEA